MNSPASRDGSESGNLAQRKEPGIQTGEEGQDCRPEGETSQAERAAMHPDQHDLEWRYYCHAWSH